LPDSCDSFPMRRDEIEAWCDAHSNELPSGLAELSRYPMAFRRVIINRVPGATRAAMWSDHFRAVLESEPELSAEQRLFLADLISRAPALFAGTVQDAQPRLAEVFGRIPQLFTPVLAQHLFTSIGMPEPPGGLPLPADARG
jgi:hypothetical protein